MRTLVTGANGQLGKSIKNLVIQQQISDSFVFATRDQLNLSDLQSLESYFETHTFDLIINCAVAKGLTMIVFPRQFWATGTQGSQVASPS